MKNGKNECCGIVPLEHEISECADPSEVAKKVKMAFKKMPGETALAGFAKIMTADFPHNVKVGMWDAVRYSRIWWGVDDVLKGSVMENPVVQQAFADALPMREWLVANRRGDWEDLAMTLAQGEGFSFSSKKELHRLIYLVTHYSDSDASEVLEKIPSSCAVAKALADFSDWRGNNFLWYLIYRDDQQAYGGFACPCIERGLLRLGVDPNRKNNLGLCWNDVRRHVIRPEM